MSTSSDQIDDDNDYEGLSDEPTGFEESFTNRSVLATDHKKNQNSLTLKVNSDSEHSDYEYDYNNYEELMKEQRCLKESLTAHRSVPTTNQKKNQNSLPLNVNSGDKNKQKNRSDSGLKSVKGSQ